MVPSPSQNHTQSHSKHTHRDSTTSNRTKASSRYEREGKGKSDDKDDPKYIGPWKIGRTIGRGSSGRVKIAKHTKTGKYAAVKIVPRQLLLNSRMSISEAKADKMMLGIEREIVIMKLIEHPNVLRLYDVWETGTELYLIMEYVEGGELFDYLVANGKLEEDEALHYFQQLISGVDYCHRFNICHRDLKPENLLLDKHKNIKIADFGMAALERENKLLETSCGSPHYASPEIVSGSQYHGSSSDIWSCGVILFALLVGRLPFDDENIRNLLAKVKVGKFNMPSDVPILAQDLIRRMVEVNPGKRITMEGIRSHPWFKKRPPRPLPIYSQPPTPQEIERPVSRSEDIDADILANIRVLWNNIPEQAIVEALISKQKNWEKVFYFLLNKYRSRNLENFDEEDWLSRSVEIPRPKTPRKITERESTSTSAAGHETLREKSPILPLNNTATPTSPHTFGRPLPPIPEATPTKPPKIQLQEPTPRHDEHVEKEKEIILAPQDVGLRPPSPVFPIQIPQVEDQAMQRFFNDIVEQLQTMSTGQSPTLGSPTPSQMNSGFRSPRVASTELQLPEQGGFGNAVDVRFEDADSESSFVDIKLVRPSARNASHLGVSPGISRPRSSSPRTSTRITSNGSYASSGISSGIVNRQPSGSSIVGSRGGRGIPPLRTSCQVQNPHRSMPLPSRPPPALNRIERMRHSMDNKENQFRQIVEVTGAARKIPSPKSISPKNGNTRKVPLGLAIQSVQIPGFESVDRATPLKKKRVETPPHNAGDPLGPRQSWFANLFNWKQLSYTLLSTDSINTTRRDCRELLLSFGVSVDETEGALKCRVEEIVDHTTKSSILKPVKFRLEFTSRNTITLTPNEQSPKHITCLNMVMERGAHSTFTAIYNRLQKEWEPARREI